MASISSRRTPLALSSNGKTNTDKSRQIKRSHSLLVHSRPPTVNPKERTSSLRREESLKGPRDLSQYAQQLLSPIEMFREQLSLQRRSKKRGGPVVDSSYERPSSPLLGFHSPLQTRRRMMHAKSCDMTPYRLKLRMQAEADCESNSSEESWNVAAVDVQQENSSCQIAQLNCSPTSQRRKVWTLDHNTSHHSPSYTTDSSTTTSRSQSPVLNDTSGRPTPDLSHTPDICVSEATPPLSAKQASLRLQMVHNMRACHSTSALYTKSTNQSTDRSELVLHELMKTERRYISNLDLLLNKLLPALEETVAARDLRLLFPCQLELLLEWHKQFLEQLEDRTDPNSDNYGIVGDVFRGMCSRDTGTSEFFNMYSAYMNEFKVAMKTLAKYEHTSQTFMQELRNCQKLAECDGLPLSAFLLTPVQRLPRYELLLKDLLKHTPVSHRDRYFLEDATDLLHEELLRLNTSIKSCELACSVTRIRNNAKRSGSIRKLGSRGRMAGRQLAKQLMKHLSTTSFEDLSIADSNHTAHSEMPRPISDHKKTLSVTEMRDRTLYTSAENLQGLESIGEQEKNTKRPASNIERTSSCINLASDYEKHPEKKRYSQPVWPLETLESLPGTPEPSSPCSMLPQSETDDGGPRSVSRASVHSNTSSTSGEDAGIGSANSQVGELDSTLTLTPSSPHTPSTPLTPSSPVTTLPPSNTSLDDTPTNPTSSAHPTVAEPTPHRPIIVSARHPGGGGSSSAQRRWRKRISWAGAFVMPRFMGKKKISVPDLTTAGKRTSRDISFPMDFRHIQHGYPPSAPDPVS